jgi:PST family polysaccharide transporter
MAGDATAYHRIGVERDQTDHLTARLHDGGANIAVEDDLPDAPADLTSRAAGGFMWALIGFVFIQIGSFGTYTVASRILGPESIGLVGTLLTVIFWADVLLDVGMGAFTVNTAMAIIVAGVVVAIAPLIAGFFGAPDEVGLFRVLGVLVLAKGLNQVPDALLRRDLQFRRRVWADLTRSVGRFGLALTLLLAGWGVEGMLIAIVCSELASVAVTWALVGYRPRPRVDRVVAGQMLRYGAPVFGSRLVGMLWLNGDYLVVGRTYGGRSREYGNYYTAFRLPELILGSFYNIFASVAFPTFSAAREEGPKRLQNAMLRSLRLLCLVGFPAGIGISIIARDFVTVVFGSGFSGAIAPMEILGIAGAITGIGYASGDLFNAIGRSKLGLMFNLAGTPVLIAGFIAVADRGIVAIATVHLIVIIPLAIARIEVANRLIGTTWSQALAAMWPGTAAVLGILAATLPLRLTLPAGFGTLVALLGAGAVGAVVGLALGARPTFTELVDLARKAIGR